MNEKLKKTSLQKKFDLACLPMRTYGKIILLIRKKIEDYKTYWNTVYNLTEQKLASFPYHMGFSYQDFKSEAHQFINKHKDIDNKSLKSYGKTTTEQYQSSMKGKRIIRKETDWQNYSVLLFL